MIFVKEKIKNFQKVFLLLYTVELPKNPVLFLHIFVKLCKCLFTEEMKQVNRFMNYFQ